MVLDNELEIVCEEAVVARMVVVFRVYLQGLR
jgi:hypothetical protein